RWSNSGWQTADAGTQQLQLLFNTLVTTVNVVHAVDNGVAVCHQAGDHKASRGPQVGRHDRSPGQMFDTLDDGSVTLKGNVCSHPDQFLQVHEAVFKYGFDDGSGPLGHRIHGGKLSLHIRGERRIRRGPQADCLGPLAFHIHLNPVRAGRAVRARLFQLEQHGFKDIFPGIFYFHPATGRSGRHQVGSGFDPVRQYVVVASVQALHAIDFNGCSTVAFDIGAHSDQTLGQIHHFRLAGRVFEDGFTLGQRSGHHQVFGTRYGDRIQENVGALQPAIGLGLDVAILHLDIGTHHFQTVDVQVYRAGTDGTATPQGDFGFAKMSYQRAKHQYRCAHGFHQLVDR